MELRRQLAVIRSWFWFLIASILLAGASAYLVSSALPKVYEAKVTLIVGQSLSTANPNYNDILVSQRISQTYADLALTAPILAHVIDETKLGITPADLRKRIVASAPLNSTLVTITAQDGDPGRAADIANSLADQLGVASDAVSGQSGAAATFVRDQIKATQVQISETQAGIDRLTALMFRSTADEQTLQVLQGRVTSLRQSYALLLGLSQSSSTLITVVDPATAAVDAASPRVLLNTVLAALAGLLLALGLAFVIEYLDDSLKNAADVEAIVGLPTLGLVPKMRAAKGKSEIYRLATILYPRSRDAEAYRTLRTNVEFAAVDTPVRTLLVTSAIPGEGKTTTAANLAVVFAQAGRRTLLIDADFRRPGVHRIFNLPNAQGLSDLIRSDEANLANVAQPTEQENLLVITTGPLPPNPAELLGSKRTLAVLERLIAASDLVVVDSPPLQAVTDAAILSSITDGTLFVIYAGKTRRGAVQAAREALAKAGAKTLGVALNRLSEGRGGGSYYYDYYGSYGKGGDGKGGGKGAQRNARGDSRTSGVDPTGGDHT